MDNSENSQLKSDIAEKVRKQVEKCSSLEGFLLTRNVSGATGSGLGSMVLEGLVEYEKAIKAEVNLFSNPFNPAGKNNLESAANSVLALNSSDNYYSDICFCLDTGSLNKMCTKYLDIKNPSGDDINQVVSYFLQTLTLPFRYYGPINTDLKSLARNLVMFPRLKHVIPALSPIYSKNKANNVALNTLNLTNNLFQPDYSLLDYVTNAQKGDVDVIMSSFISYQGPDFSLADIDSSIKSFQTLKTPISNGGMGLSKFSVAINSRSPSSSGKLIDQGKNAILGLHLSTAVRSFIHKVCTDCSKLKENQEKFKAYLGNNDVAKFDEAYENISDLNPSYKNHATN